jgi:hypothetical protein
MASKTTDTTLELDADEALIAIDPGNKISGWVVFFPVDEDDDMPFGVVGFGRTENKTLRQQLRDVTKSVRNGSRLVIEMPRARGMPTANEEFLTCVEIGKFLMAWGGPWSFAFRMDIKLAICGQARATDSNVRTALIDIFGGKQKAVGGKKCTKCKGKGWVGVGRPTCPKCGGAKWEQPPGPLHGMAEDEWAALAVAAWWMQEGKVQHDIPAPKQKHARKSSSAGRRPRKARTSAAIRGRK